MSTPPSLPVTKNSGLAIWSLVLGILALVLCFIGPLLAIPAVICGHMAFNRIKNSGGMLGGKGLATGGLITGYLSLALIPVIGLLAAIAIPNFVKARNTALSNSCINQMRAIDSAIEEWALENGKPDGSVIDEAGVAKYMSGGVIPRCPAGGYYSLGASVGTKPSVTCPNENGEMHKLPR